MNLLMFINFLCIGALLPTIYYTGSCDFIEKTTTNAIVINTQKSEYTSIVQNNLTKFYHTTSTFKFMHYTLPRKGAGIIALLDKEYSIGKDCLNYNPLSGHYTFDISEEDVEVYDFTIANKHYVVISAFSSLVAEQKDDVVIFNIFEVTNPDDVKYYMMRSTNGASCNIGDFNNDGVLDFISAKKAWNNEYTLTLYTLRNNDFVVYEDSHNWIYSTTLTETAEGFSVLCGHWFN